jgi:hypothetical protein
LIYKEEVVLWVNAMFEALSMLFGSSSMIMRGVASIEKFEVFRLKQLG